LEWYPHHMFSTSLLHQNLVAFGNFYRNPSPNWPNVGENPWGKLTKATETHRLCFTTRPFLGWAPTLATEASAFAWDSKFPGLSWPKKQNHSGDHWGYLKFPNTLINMSVAQKWVVHGSPPKIGGLILGSKKRRSNMTQTSVRWDPLRPCYPSHFATVKMAPLVR